MPKIGDLKHTEWVRRTVQTDIPKHLEYRGLWGGLGDIQHLSEDHPWRFSRVTPNMAPCVKAYVVSLGPDAMRRGLRSQVVKQSKRPEFVVEIIGATYEFKVCDCAHEPWEQWVLQEEYVIKKIHPKPTALDRLAVI